MRYDGVVLAGGAARRLGGVSKPAITVGGRALLDISLDALAGAATTIAVGAPMSTSRPVTWTREDPIGGGPVAALAAALPIVTAPHIVLLAADLPFVTGHSIAELVGQCEGAAAVLAVDDNERDQPLLACYDTALLRAALPANPTGTSMRSVLRELEWAGPMRRVAFHASPPATLDCDTEADLSRARTLA
jgi:molybdopterin-guanine dinucleotide biosynthesis protein A